MMGTKFQKIRRSRPILVMSLLVISGLLPVLMISPEPVEGAVLYVGASSTYTTIQDAVDDASPGDRIVIAPGEYTESVNVAVSGIRMMGNDSVRTFITSMNNQPAVSVNANLVSLSELTLKDGALALKGDNFTGSELVLEVSGNTGAVIISSRNITFINVTVNNSFNGGLLFKNCTNIDISGLGSSHSTGEVVNVTDSTSLSLQNSEFSLGNRSTGLRILNVSNIRLQRVSFSSAGIDNTGAYLENCSDILLDLLNTMVNSTGIVLEDCRDTLVRSGTFIEVYKGASGVVVDSCTNTTISMNTFVIPGGQIGISVQSSSFTQIDNASFQIESNGAIGIQVEASTDLVLQDSNAVHLFEPSTFLSVHQSRNIREINNLVNLLSNDATGSQVQDTMNFSMEGNLFSSSGISDTFLYLLGGTNNCTIAENLFDSSGESSNAIHVMDSADIRFMNNSVTCTGNVSNGYIFENGARFLLADEVVQVSGTDDKGITIEGSDFVVRNTLINVMGQSSTGLMFIGSRNGSVSQSLVHVTGELSTGLMMISVESDLTVSDLEIVLNLTEGMGIFTDNDNGRLELSGLSMNSSTTAWYSSLLSKGVIHMTGLEVTSPGPGILIENCDDGWISDSVIDTTVTGLTFRQCTMNITDSDVSGIVLMESSNIISIDSKVDPVMEVSGSSQLDIMNTVKLTALTKDLGPFPGVDMEVETWGNKVYQTPYFDPASTDPRTDASGSIKDMTYLDRRYIDTSPEPLTGYTNVTVHAEGTSSLDWDEVFTINVSYPHTEYFISPDIDLPQTPVNFTVRQVDTKEALFLNWDPNSDDTVEYFVYSLDPDTGSQGLEDRIPSNRSSWISGNLGPSKRMFYWISAFDGTWESETTELVQGTTRDLTPPAQPLLLSYVNSTMDSITLSWTHAGETDLAGFKVFMSGSGQVDFEIIATIGPEARTYTATELEFSTTYRFQVQAFDESDNHSPFSRILQASTELPMVEFRVAAYYSDDGPRAGLPAANCSLELISFNGSVKGVTKTNETGVGIFIRRDAYESYSVRVLPPQEILGEEGVITGYLPATSALVTVDPYITSVQINLTMDYYRRVMNGTIRLKVIYGEGPRSGVVYMAMVELEHEDGAIVEEKLTNSDGAVVFMIGDLPFRGRFRITPPELVAGDPSNNRSGYIGLTTNFFELTSEDPDQNMGEVALEYYSFVQEPEDLLLVATNPYGSAVDPASPVIIKFNQPVRTQTVIDSLQVSPALKNPVYSWSDGNKTLRIEHDGLVPKTTYQVTVGIGSRSEAGTSFPLGYNNNTWTFTTTAIPGSEDGEDNDRYVIYAVAIGAIIIVIIVLIYMRLGSKKDEEDDLEKPYSSFGDYDDEEDDDEEFEEDEDEYFDEDYPDDIAEQMDDELPYDDEDLDDYYDEDEEFGEDEEIDEGPQEADELDEMEEEMDEDLEEEE
ncbi:MAG: fibronectin type III domain-containing protein [Thermoplasmatota archaeon]